MGDQKDHQERLQDSDVDVHFLGSLEGMAVDKTDDGPVLTVHGEHQSAAMLIENKDFCDALAQAGVQIRALLMGEEPDYQRCPNGHVTVPRALASNTPLQCKKCGFTGQPEKFDPVEVEKQ